MIMVFGAVAVGGEGIGELFNGGKAEAAGYSVGDIVTFGSYPQSEVTKKNDGATYAKLEAATKNWISYGYYSGYGSYGSMQPGDWMEYADMDINGDGANDYRAVRFTQYRPYWTRVSSYSNYSYQDDNGYTINIIYYFKFEPLKWQVLDPTKGLVLSKSIIDSQAYSNTIYEYGFEIYGKRAYWNNASYTKYANDYATSSIHKWLNEDFYNTAFTSDQKQNILPTTLDNSAYSTGFSEYDSVSTTDNVFLLSYSEAQNASYGFTNDESSTETRKAVGTDYAKAQGLWVDSSNKCSDWLLRSAGYDSYRACGVIDDGGVRVSLDVDGTEYGVRPALRLSNLASDIFDSDLSKVKDDEYAIFVTDAEGNRLPGATVTWNSEKATTGEDGMVTFKKLTVGEPRITVTKSGYITYDNQNTNYSKSSYGFDVVTLYREGSEDAYKLTSARYINGVMSQDLLVKTKRLSLSDKKGTFAISCSAATSTGVADYELMQGTKVIAKSDNGKFDTLKISSFTKGGGVKVAVILSTGKSIVTPLNLSFEEDKAVAESSISLGKAIKISVSDDIPFLGGSEISVDLPTLPLEIYVDDDGDGGGKVHVGVNANILNKKKEPETGWSDSDKKTIETQIDEIKDAIKTLSDYKDGVKKSLSKNDKKKLNKVIKEQKKSNLPGLDGVKLDFIGYGEGSWNSEGFSTVSINLFLVADLKGISYTQQFAVWVVPIVINIDAGLKATSSVIGSYDFQKKTFNADWAAKISPYLEAFGGVGVGKAVGVGAYGSATADIGIQLLGTSKPTGLDSIDLTGDMGIKAYFAIFEFKKSFAYKTYHIYSRTKKMPAKASQVKRMNMYDAANYEVQDISYLSGESAWLSGASGGPAKAPSKAPAATVIKPLLTQTYRNSQPQTVSAAGSTVMVYTGADTSRDAYNITRVMYSVYDVSSGTWSAPLQADSNTTADSAPYLWTDGTDIYMIYLDSAKQFGSGDTVESYAAAQNIAITKFNSQTGKFDPVTTVAASDGGFYSLPKLCMNGGVLTAVWQRSTGDVFGCNSSNSVIYSTFNGQSWSAPEKLADGLNSIVDISADAGNVYYICDGDNDLNTTGDRSLTKQDFGGESTLLDSGTVSSIRLDGVNVYWYSGGTYKKYDGSTAASITNEPIIGATDRFCVTDGQIMFLAATQNASDIYTVAYDPSSGEYGEPVKYTDQDQYIDTFSAASVDGQTLAVMTRRDVTITEDNVDDKCELAYTLIRDRHDIAVNSVDYDEESVIPGGNLPLRIEVGNAGTSIVNSVDVTITDAAGNVVKSETRAVSIAPGATEDLTVEIALDDKISLKKYNVTVTETGNTDANNSDNSCEFKVGYCKLDVTATPIVSGGIHYIVIGVKNVSSVASDGTLSISNSTDPENVNEIKLDVLQPGESYIYKLRVSEELLDGSKNVIKVMAESTAEFNELYSHIEHVYCNLNEFKPIDANISIVLPSTTTVSYGFTLNIHANVTDLPEDARVVWSMDGSGFELIPSADGMTCGVKSVSKGSATITAKVVDKKGNAVKDANGSEIAASQQLTSKAGFFQKLAAFFKKLFGSNMIIPYALEWIIK